MDRRGKQLYISLTSEGRKRAEQLNIDLLEIKPQKSWDGKWRMILFDIAEKTRITRDALRGKLKELGFYQVQKSVWLHAFPCEKELSILQQFFGLSDLRCMCFALSGLPDEVEERAKAHFQLS